KRFTIENPRPRRLGRSFHSALLLGALALSAATGCTQCDDESKAHSDSEAARPSAGTTTPRPVPPIVAFEKPTRFRFRLESSSTLPGQSGEAQMTITGSLWLSGHPAEDSLSVHAVLETPETLVNGKTQPEFQEMVVKMNEGAIFSFKAGVLTTLSVPSSVEPQVANLWRTIGATLQHSGQGKREGSWSAREHDSTGEYEASYRWDEDNLVRTKTKYVSLLQSGMETATLEQLEPRI